MRFAETNDFDHLAARLHARRSGRYEHGRLRELSRVPTILELSVRLGLKPDPSSARQLARQLVVGLQDEIVCVRQQTSGAAARALDWLLVGFFVENLTVWIRGRAAGRSAAEIKACLLPLPDEFQRHQQRVESLPSLAEFPRALPEGPLRTGVLRCAGIGPGEPSPFFLETAVERARLTEALARSEMLRRDDRQAIWPLLAQEADIFHLKLVTRGRLVYGLAAQALLGLEVPGTGLAGSRLRTLLAQDDLLTVARLGLRRVIDSLSPELTAASARSLPLGIAQLEALAWTRYHRLANRAFRESHLGFGAVFSYFALRRIEIVNLVALAEGIRLGVPPEARLERFLPRPERQVSHA